MNELLVEVKCPRAGALNAQACGPMAGSISPRKVAALLKRK